MQGEEIEKEKEKEKEKEEKEARSVAARANTYEMKAGIPPYRKIERARLRCQCEAV